MSYGSNAISGAGTGAAMGAGIGSIVPGISTGIGALIGGGVGLLGGLWGGAEDAANKKAYNKQLEKAAENYGVTMDQIAKAVSDFYKNKGTLLDDSSKQDYVDTITGTDWETLGKVDFDKDAYDVNDYYDQNRQQIVNAAQNDALGAANVSGSVMGSGAVGNMLSAAVSTEKDLADKAYNRMTNDRSFDYTLAKNTANQRLEAVKNKLYALGSAYQQDTADQENLFSTIANLNQSKANASLQAFMNQQV